MSQPDELLVITSTGSRLAASGEIDAHTAPSLAAAIDETGTDVALDLSAVDFVDSSGLRVLIDAHQRLTEAGGSLRIVAVSAAVRRLLDISGVTEYLQVDAS